MNGYDLDGTCWPKWACRVARAVRNGFRRADHLTKTGMHQSLRLAAVPFYGVYFGGYHLNKFAASHPALAPLRPIGWGMQAYGISWDAGIDIVKGVTCCHESIFDEHQNISVNPFHGNEKPTTFGPGLY